MEEPAIASTADEFDRLADQWDDLCGPASALADEFHAHQAILRQICEAAGRPRVLDIGCGTGQHLIHLEPWLRAGVGLDFSARMIEQASRNAKAAGAGRLGFQTGDALTIEDSVGAFDLVMFIGTLEHVADPARALQLSKDRLALGGRIVIVMPHRYSLYFLLRRWRQGGNGRLFLKDTLYDVAGANRLAASAGLLLEKIYPLPFAIARAGSPPVTWPWRTAHNLLGLIPAPMTRGAFAAVLTAAPECPRGQP